MTSASSHAVPGTNVVLHHYRLPNENGEGWAIITIGSDGTEAHATNIEVIKTAAKDLSAARTSLEAAEKRASGLQKERDRLYEQAANDLVERGHLRSRVAALEAGLKEATDAIQAHVHTESCWGRYEPCGEHHCHDDKCGSRPLCCRYREDKPRAELKTRLRALFRSEPAASPPCSTCGDHRVIADGTAAKGVSWKPCPACSASPGAGNRG